MPLAEIDFSSLEINEIGSWPLLLRILIVVVAGILAILVVYFLVLEPDLESLASQQTQLDGKRKDFKEKYTMAVNLDAYRKQMAEMQSTYQELLKELPATSDVPALVDNISKVGASDGIRFNSIKIGEPKDSSGFYMELPISFALVGTYHSFGRFVSEISRLPRIVTLGDFSIKTLDIGDKSNAISGALDMNIDAKTYWLATPSEQAAAENKQGTAAKPATPVRATPAPPPMPSAKPSAGKANANQPDLQEQGG